MSPSPKNSLAPARNVGHRGGTPRDTSINSYFPLSTTTHIHTPSNQPPFPIIKSAVSPKAFFEKDNSKQSEDEDPVCVSAVRPCGLCGRRYEIHHEIR